MSERAGRILVVDDVRENVRLLEAVLEAHGYDVVSATDGRPRSSSPSRRSPISCCST
jgi:CheY-like chemotaxis protein